MQGMGKSQMENEIPGKQGTHPLKDKYSKIYLKVFRYRRIVNK
jgi:hypothetical protein